MEELNSFRIENNKTILIVILFIFLFFWYAQLTNIAGGPILFMKNSFSNIGDMFKEEVQASGSSPLQNILLFSKRVEYGETWQDYNNKIKEDYNSEFNADKFYSEEKTSNINQNLIFPGGLIPKREYNLNIP